MLLTTPFVGIFCTVSTTGVAVTLTSDGTTTGKDAAEIGIVAVLSIIAITWAMLLDIRRARR